jgi:hypothetical protein
MALVAPSIPEWEERPREYEAAVSALRSRGIQAELAECPIPPCGSDLPDAVPLAFAVYLAAKITDVMLEVIATELVDLLRARASCERKEAAKGVIYGPEGQVLREIVLPPTEEKPGAGPPSG